MGSLKIQDSGYIKSTNTGTQASASNRAYSGNAVTLKSFEFTPSLNRSYDDSPDLGTNTPSEVNLGSLENMKFELKCVLNKQTSGDMDLIKELLDFVCTDGYKFLWYDYTDSTTEWNNGSLVYQIARNSKFGHQFTTGELTKFTVTAQYYHLHVTFFDIQPRESATAGKIEYVMKGVIHKVETSTI
jgi:hypothetical protein